MRMTENTSLPGRCRRPQYRRRVADPGFEQKLPAGAWLGLIGRRGFFVNSFNYRTRGG